MHKIAIVIPITRYWALNQLFESLLKIKQPAGTELRYVFYVDSPDPRIKNGLDYWIERINDNTAASCVWHYSKRPEPTEVRIAARRERVVEVHKDIVKLNLVGDADFVFGVEDDTILPDYALERLYRYITTNENVGLVQGVQCGRWGHKMIGAWRVNDIANPTKVLTMPYLAVNRTHSFVEKIDGGGFFCYLTPAKLFMEADYRVEATALGVDMLYGIDLKRKGFDNYIDWSVVCGHNDFGVIILPEIGDPVEQVFYEKEGDEWHMSVRAPGQEWERKY